MMFTRTTSTQLFTVLPVAVAALCLLVSGCSSGSPAATVAAISSSKQYAGPNMNSSGNPVLTTFAVDRSTKTFVQNTYDPSNGNQEYIRTSGMFTQLAQGVLGLSLTYACPGTSVCLTGGVTYTPAQTGSFLVEIPGEALLAQIAGFPFVPAAPNASCPTSGTSVTYQFLTIPGPLSAKPAARLYSPSTDVGYGTFSLKASGDSLTFGAIQQFTLPAGMAPINPSPASVTGTCSTSLYGQVITVPSYTTVTNPGNAQSILPTATIAIGPAGFLVEDNGAFSTLGGTTSVNPYQNILGAGIGAVGLRQPLSPVTPSTVTAQKYSGFIYAGGGGAAGSSSSVASFNLSGQTACPSLPPASSNVIYGGEFAGNDPAAHGSGNCDLAVDLGVQDPKNNGLFPTARIYVGGSYPSNNGGKGTTYSFPAVAIAGQLAGQSALFVLGIDTVGSPNQGLGLYLLQAN